VISETLRLLPDDHLPRASQSLLEKCCFEKPFFKEIGETDKMNALDMIDQELAKAQEAAKARAAAKAQAGKPPLFLFFKPGHSARIRPLYNLSEALTLAKHDVYNDNPDLKVAAICAKEIGQPCQHCQTAAGGNKKMTAGMRFYLPVYVYKVVDQDGNTITYNETDENGNKTPKPVQGIRVLELTSFGSIGAILKWFRTYVKDPDNNATITACDFTITQVGSGQTKTFTVMPKAPKPIDPRLKAIIPPLDKVRARILETLPPKKATSAEQDAEDHWNETGQNMVIPPDDESDFGDVPEF
jgi:hypothetical protein